MTTTDTTKTSLPLPPGSLGLPVVGESISFLRDPKFMDKRQKKYGSIFKTHVFGRPTVVMIGPEANRFVLMGENQYFTMSWPHSTEVLLGQSSLSIQQGSVHQSRRKLLSQIFQPKAIAGYLPIMEPIVLSYLQKWQQLGTFTWYPELRDLTFDVACTLLVKTQTGSQTQLSQLFKDWSDGLFSVALPLPWTKFGKALRARQQLLIQIGEIVKVRQQQQIPSQDALGLLLEARDEEGNSLSLSEMKDQILMLLFAGHETVTSALSSLCLLLAQHPDVLLRLRTEQQQFAFNEPLTMDQLKQMTYLEQVIKEVLRILPPVGGGFRKVLKPFELNGYSVPEGWIALYQIAQSHQDPSIYAEPEQFDPDRFGLERAEDKQKSFSFVPYGGGARECLGKALAQLVMKVFAVHLVRSYTWEVLPNQNLEFDRIPTPHPRDGLRVRFEHLS
jgi:cytochrome P450